MDHISIETPDCSLNIALCDTVFGKSQITHQTEVVCRDIDCEYPSFFMEKVVVKDDDQLTITLQSGTFVIKLPPGTFSDVVNLDKVKNEIQTRKERESFLIEQRARDQTRLQVRLQDNKKIEYNKRQMSLQKEMQTYVNSEFIMIYSPNQRTRGKKLQWLQKNTKRYEEMTQIRYKIPYLIEPALKNIER